MDPWRETRWRDGRDGIPSQPGSLEVTRSRCNSIKLALYLSGRTLTELDSPLLHPHRHMADFDFEPQQANHLPGDSFPRSIVRRGPQHHHTLQVSLKFNIPRLNEFICLCMVFFRSLARPAAANSKGNGRMYYVRRSP